MADGQQTSVMQIDQQGLGLIAGQHTHLNQIKEQQGRIVIAGYPPGLIPQSVTSQGTNHGLEQLKIIAGQRACHQLEQINMATSSRQETRRGQWRETGASAVQQTGFEELDHQLQQRKQQLASLRSLQFWKSIQRLEMSRNQSLQQQDASSPSGIHVQTEAVKERLTLQNEPLDQERLPLQNEPLDQERLPLQNEPLDQERLSLQNEPLDLSAKRGKKQFLLATNTKRKCVDLAMLQKARPRLTITAGRNLEGRRPRSVSPEPEVSVSVHQPGQQSLLLYHPIHAVPLRPSLKKRFPQLKGISTGSVVLWSFLWALLLDTSFVSVVRWTSVAEMEFFIAAPEELASLWATVKDDPCITWESVKKVLRVYTFKGILSGRVEDCQFKFLVVPKESTIQLHPKS